MSPTPHPPAPAAALASSIKEAFASVEGFNPFLSPTLADPPPPRVEHSFYIWSPPPSPPYHIYPIPLYCSIRVYTVYRGSEPLHTAFLLLVWYMRGGRGGGRVREKGWIVGKDACLWSSVHICAAHWLSCKGIHHPSIKRHFRDPADRTTPRTPIGGFIGSKEESHTPLKWVKEIY